MSGGEGGPNTVGKFIPYVMAIGAIMAAYKISGGDYLFETFIKKDMEDSYDYIIVGGGTTGSILASRITEDSDKTVLLIEAGIDPSGNEQIDIPIAADTVRMTEFDWDYRTMPQNHSCKSHNDKVSAWPSGKGLGGSSNLNYMQYLRGSRHDYDEWANNGATGWAYKDILPYFIKSEDNKNGEHVRTVFHGFGGRVTVTDIQVSPINRIIQNTFKHMGLKYRDTNGKNMFGYCHTQATIRYGARWGSYKAFLKRALKRPNLYILTQAEAQKIIFEGRRATGVVFKHNGEQHTIKANKEVIVSAGTVGSTKLLLLSGIGPRRDLQALKIPVIADVPVGQNLQDHVMGDGIQFFTPYNGGFSITPAKAENFIQSWAWSIFGTGMKQSPRFREGTAYVKTRQQPPHIKYPLVGLHFVASISAYDSTMVNVNEKSWNLLHDNLPTKDGFTVFPVLLHPRSKGTIRLKSSNPEDPPLINPNYLAEDADVKILIDAVKFTRNLVNQKPLQDWEFKVNDRLLPECSKFGNFTNAYIECYLRHITLTGYSPVGTCKMGAAGDPTAVVDPLLRVRTLKGLRVVDASIIPNAVTGNSYTTQIMIAEKASDMIRDKDTVKAIREYFKHLISVKHKRITEDEEVVPVVSGEDDKKGKKKR